MLFADLPPHRQLVGVLEAALACLDEAVALDTRGRVLPHWALVQVREMTEDLAALLDQVARESPALAPLRKDEQEGAG